MHGTSDAPGPRGPTLPAVLLLGGSVGTLEDAHVVHDQAVRQVGVGDVAGPPAHLETENQVLAAVTRLR